LTDGSAWIDYPGPNGTVPAVSFARVYRKLAPRSMFSGKVVVIGATDTNLQDMHKTSEPALVSGPEIEADAIATALNGFPLRQAGGALTICLILLLAAAPALINARLSAGRALLLSLVPGVLLLIAAQLLFDANLIIAVVTPLAALILSAFGALGVNYIDEAFHRQATRLAFARFVPAAVVDEVLQATGPGIRLGGVRRVSTVMFSDLRGFTSFSEHLDPEQVITILNRYLTAMSDAILNHGGTLVAYMGDGIMAVFGAPLEYEDHADRALAAAQEMLERLSDFNVWLSAEHGFPALRMGIGLNSGPVMSGNVGSEQRLEYTALGDTTNTAARLEGMTKGTPHQLYMADSTRAMLLNQPTDLLYVDEFEVRGREAKVKIWSTPWATD
jgi:adenylate cyclase